MGKQVRFYMTFEDEKQFLEAAQSASACSVILTSFSRPDDMVVNELQPSKGLADSFYAILQAKEKEGLKPTYISETGRYSVNVTNCNVVQFNRCYITANRLVSGRLWYETVKKKKKKTDEFLAWAEKLTKWIKKNYKRDEQGFYVGPDALLQAGQGKFILGYPQ